jgi:hypothetical protein
MGEFKKVFFKYISALTTFLPIAFLYADRCVEGCSRNITWMLIIGAVAHYYLVRWLIKKSLPNEKTIACLVDYCKNNTGDRCHADKIDLSLSGYCHSFKKGR